MHLHLIGPEVKTADGFWNFSGVYAYFLRAEFLARGIELSFSPQTIRPEFMEIPWSADHVLALGNRYFDKTSAAASILRRKCHGLITQLSDHGVDFPDACDLTFCLKESFKPRHVTVGWAAAPDWFRPAQSKSARCVLLDHPNYSSAGDDLTYSLLGQALRTTADVAMVWSDGIKPVYRHELPSQPFERGRVPYLTLAAQLGFAHVFVVTHSESLGQMALEAAMSGALVVVPRGFMARDRLSTIRHLTFDNQIPWTAVWSVVNPEASRAFAIRNDWKRLADKILKEFGWKPTT